MDENHILSHVFLNCLNKQQLTKIAKVNEGLPDEEIKAREIEVEVKINGISVNPKAFFDLYNDQYIQTVKEQATKMLKEQVSDKFYEITNKIDEYNNIIQSLSDDINWDTTNLIVKK